MMLDSLRRQLAEQSKLAIEERAAFMEDRRIREQENQLRFSTYQDKIQQLEGLLKEQQEINHRTMKGMCYLKGLLEISYMNCFLKYLDHFGCLLNFLTDYFQLRYEYKTKEENRVAEHVAMRTEMDTMRQQTAIAMTSAKNHMKV